MLPTNHLCTSLSAAGQPEPASRGPPPLLPPRAGGILCRADPPHTAAEVGRRVGWGDGGPQMAQWHGQQQQGSCAGQLQLRHERSAQRSAGLLGRATSQQCRLAQARHSFDAPFCLPRAQRWFKCAPRHSCCLRATAAWSFRGCGSRYSAQPSTSTAAVCSLELRHSHLMELPPGLSTLTALTYLGLRDTHWRQGDLALVLAPMARLQVGAAVRSGRLWRAFFSLARLCKRACIEPAAAVYAAGPRPSMHHWMEPLIRCLPLLPFPSHPLVAGPGPELPGPAQPASAGGGAGHAACAGRCGLPVCAARCALLRRGEWGAGGCYWQRRDMVRGACDVTGLPLLVVALAA